MVGSRFGTWAKDGLQSLTLGALMALALASAASARPGRQPYLGQDPPGLQPEVFAPGAVSTADVSEFSCTFSPDGGEFYFSRQTGEKMFSIFVTRETDAGWTTPELASFSGDFFNHEPYITPDGTRIYWGSIRPLPTGDTNYSVWYADRIGDSWGEPNPLPFSAMYITSSADGTLYYTGKGRGGGVLARSITDDAGNVVHEVLGEPLLSDHWDGHPCIAPDESFLIFDSETRPETDECGLFISFATPDGGWTEPVNMKSVIHKGRYAMLSPDGKYLFFAAPGVGTGKDIYWVDIRILDRFKP